MVGSVVPRTGGGERGGVPSEEVSGQAEGGVLFQPGFVLSVSGFAPAGLGNPPFPLRPCPFASTALAFPTAPPQPPPPRQQGGGPVDRADRGAANVPEL